MKARTALAVVLAALLGAAVWAASPLVSGHEEPWDGDGLFYIGSLAAAGLISGLSIPKPLWTHYVGSVAGQLTYQLVFLPLGPLLLLGVVFLLGYSLLFLAGAAIGSALRRHFDARTTAA